MKNIMTLFRKKSYQPTLGLDATTTRKWASKTYGIGLGLLLLTTTAGVYAATTPTFNGVDVGLSNGEFLTEGVWNAVVNQVDASKTVSDLFSVNGDNISTSTNLQILGDKWMGFAKPSAASVANRADTANLALNIEPYDDYGRLAFHQLSFVDWENGEILTIDGGATHMKGNLNMQNGTEITMVDSDGSTSAQLENHESHFTIAADELHIHDWTAGKTMVRFYDDKMALDTPIHTGGHAMEGCPCGTCFATAKVHDHDQCAMDAMGASHTGAKICTPNGWSIIVPGSGQCT